MKRHLLSIEDLDRDDIEAVLETAVEMHDIQHRDVKKLPTLRGRTIINLFFEDSTRTRGSFEVAGKWMSADTINITGKGSSTSKGESLRDTVMTIAAMGADCLIVRHSASGAARQVSQWVDAVVINAGDGTHEHPTQALLDAYTMRARLGDLAGRRVAIVGDLLHSRVARSNLLCLRTLGAQVTLVGPPTLMPAGIAAWAAADGFATSYDLDEVIASGPDVLMMLRVQRERMSGGFFPSEQEYAATFGLSRRRLAALLAANREALVAHPGPMNRGLEISSDAADAAPSVILDQVSAGVAVRMSVLYHLLAGSGAAAGSGTPGGTPTRAGATR
ncbi:MAG: aspartate carbamoyltransferase catalytic subunit [Austwickia sp.]|nr:aspartate carbamoyltransferase catalytic subunit [Austwickia sp.]